MAFHSGLTPPRAEGPLIARTSVPLPQPVSVTRRRTSTSDYAPARRTNAGTPASTRTIH